MKQTDVDTAAPERAAPEKETRLVALDALRGFSMFWIMGADEFVTGLNQVLHEGGVASAGADAHPIAAFFARQLQHVEWEGFHFYDLIFPLFIFVMGASIVLSLEKQRATGDRAGTYWRIARRFVLLYLLGMWSDGGAAAMHEENMLCGVLQRLALCYFITSLLYCQLGRRGLCAAAIVMLAGYWAVLTFVPNPEDGKTTLVDEHNLIHYVDKQIPPYYAPDSESLPSVFPSVAGCLIGVLAVQRLRRPGISPRNKALGFIVCGAVMTAAGYLWGLEFPMIKKLWTSSFILVASGYSLVLLGVFYTVIDVWKFERWSRPFVWIGSNALAIYLAMNVVNFKGAAARAVGGPIAGAFGVYGDLFLTAASMIVAVLCLRYLYQKRIFIRI